VLIHEAQLAGKAHLVPWLQVLVCPDCCWAVTAELNHKGVRLIRRCYIECQPDPVDMLLPFLVVDPTYYSIPNNRNPNKAREGAAPKSP